MAYHKVGAAKAGYVALHGKDHESCVFQFLMLLLEILFCFIW